LDETVTRYLAPTIVGWNGREDPELRRRVERAVTAGVRRAIAATSPATAATGPHRRDGAFAAWGPDPEHGLWVLPGFDDGGGGPVAVPVLPSAVADSYSSSAEIRSAIAAGHLLRRVRQALGRRPAVPLLRDAHEHW
jgi:hypothetical protein